MLAELVDANHHVFAGCAECRQTVTFTVPGTTSRPHWRWWQELRSLRIIAVRNDPWIQFCGSQIAAV